MRVTFQFAKNIYKKTGVNILGLSKDEWFATNPEVQTMVINEYRLLNKKPILEEGEIPDNFAFELVEAINFFMLPSKPIETGTSLESTLSSDGSDGQKKI